MSKTNDKLKGLLKIVKPSKSLIKYAIGEYVILKATSKNCFFTTSTPGWLRRSASGFSQEEKELMEFLEVALKSFLC